MKKNRNNNRIRNFVTKNEVIIHLGVFLLALMIGIVSNALGIQEQMDILIELILLLIGDFAVCKIINSKNGKENNSEKEITVLDFNGNTLKELYNSITKDLFISGITLSGFIGNKSPELERLVKAGKKVRVLVSAPDALGINTLNYFGVPKSQDKMEENLSHARSCLSATITKLLTSRVLCLALESGLLEFRIIAAPLTTSCLGFDFFDGAEADGTLVTSIYQYGCRDFEKEPNWIVSADTEPDKYNNILNSSKNLWNDARAVTTVNSLKLLKKKLNT